MILSEQVSASYWSTANSLPTGTEPITLFVLRLDKT